MVRYIKWHSSRTQLLPRKLKKLSKIIYARCGGKTYEECSSCNVHKLINALLTARSFRFNELVMPISYDAGLLNDEKMYKRFYLSEKLYSLDNATLYSC